MTELVLEHTEPCSECPWRKEAPAGWLGGVEKFYYSDAIAAGEIPNCHKSTTAFCAGACSVMANMIKIPFKQEGAAPAVTTVGKREDTFSHFANFHQHHHGEPWVHPLMRT